MDLRAKAAWATFHQQGGQVHALVQGEPWPLWLGPRKVCRDLHRQVIDHVHGTTARQWWAKRNHFPESSTSTIDWNACGRALKSSARAWHHWITKHNSGFCAVGRNMARWNQWPQSNCPRCSSENETNTHVILCPEETATHTWLTAIHRLRQWMLSQKTEPGICRAICSNLLSWRSNTEPTRNTSYFRGLAAALQAQATIGWKALLAGFIAIEWSGVQEAYYQWVGSRRSGRRWAAALIKKIWEVSWDMWEHRNGFVHTPSANTVASRAITRALRQEHALGIHSLPRQDQHLFRITLDTLLQSRVEVQQAWLSNVKAARARSQRCDHATYRRERQFLRNWLQGPS